MINFFKCPNRFIYKKDYLFVAIEVGLAGNLVKGMFMWIIGRQK